MINAEERAARQSESPAIDPRVPPMRADDHSNAHPAEPTPVESRQGFLGRPVLMVLVGGLVLAAIAWLVLGVAGF